MKEHPACWTIEAFEKISKETRRTIRYFVARELLEKPSGRGRGAYYNANHLAQIRRIRELIRKGMPLAGIKERFDAEGKAAARQSTPGQAPAAEQRILALPPAPASVVRDSAASLSPSFEPTVITARLHHPAFLVASQRSAPATPQLRTERQLRTELLPGIEITYPEGAFDDDALRQFEQLARQLCVAPGKEPR